jgi:hypothetical protein
MMKRDRRGIGLLEMAVAGAMLGTLLAVCLQLLAAMAAQRSAADQRQLAVLEVENAMERLTARPWADLTPKTAAPQLPPSLAARLPKAEMTVEISQSAADAAAKRIAISISQSAADAAAKRIAISLRWQDHAGQFVRPVKIVTWQWKRADEKQGERP